MRIDARPPATGHVGVDRMIDLVHGLLEPADARMAVTHVTRCPACERSLREQAGTLERARATADAALRPVSLPAPRSHDALRAALTATHGPATPAAMSLVRTSRIDRLLPWCVGLASAACVVTALLLPSRPVDPSMRPRPWLPDPGDQIIARDGDGTGSTDLREGLAAYERRDLATAERLLDAAASPGPGDQLRRLHLSDLLLRTGRPRAALEQLSGVRIADIPEPWGSEARWMLLLALRGAGERTRADSLQRVLAAESGELGQRARAVTPIHP